MFRCKLFSFNQMSRKNTGFNRDVLIQPKTYWFILGFEKRLLLVQHEKQDEFLFFFKWGGGGGGGGGGAEGEKWPAKQKSGRQLVCGSLVRIFSSFPS